jgi:Nitric oxide synthase, oxygenase domain
MNVMKVGERANPELTGDTLEEARSFLELLRAERVIDTQTYRRRLGQISCAVVRHGHYRMESSELEHACRVAWRQSSRCIGRLPWKTLIVRDCRELVTPEEIFGACVDHLRFHQRRPDSTGDVGLRRRPRPAARDDDARFGQLGTCFLPTRLGPRWT